MIFNGTGATVTNNADANNAYFVDVARNDFRLTASAVNAIDRGTAIRECDDYFDADKDRRRPPSRLSLGHWCV